jgi:carboxypeptidase C (cathepsin A)
MTNTLNTAAFEAWIKATGRKWNHLNTAEKQAAAKEYQVTQAEETREEAIEQFNERMSNACTQADRDEATRLLAGRLCSMADAQRLCRDWMAQQDQAAREARQ